MDTTCRCDFPDQRIQGGVRQTEPMELDVFRRAVGGDVIEAYDLPARTQKFARRIAAEKTGDASNQDGPAAHPTSRRFRVSMRARSCSKPRSAASRRLSS